MSKSICLGLAAFSILLCTNAAGIAQENNDQKEVEATSPEMWYYQQQLNQYNDPKVAVRKKAELRAQQRMARIEARKWLGYDPARPSVSSAMLMTSYGAAWHASSQQFYARYFWARPTIIVQGTPSR